jgi:hypothetical protein
MKIKNQLLAVALLAVGFSAGICAGEWHAAKVEREGLKRTATIMASEEAYLAYRLGTYENAKRLLLQDVELLDEPARSGDRYAGGESSAEGAMNNYVRLAKLEERRGDDGARAAYMREAVARCSNLRQWRRDCSEQTLRGIVDRLDIYPAQPN